MIIHPIMRAIVKRKLKNPESLIKLLMKAEHGWANSLGKLASSLPYEDIVLKFEIWQQADEEHQHGNMLAFLIDAPRAKGISDWAADEKVGAVASYITPLQKILRRSLDTYGLEDRLAFAFWVEVAAKNFYLALEQEASDPKIKNVARAIAEDEIGHKSYILEVLIEHMGRWQAFFLLAKWAWKFIAATPEVWRFVRGTSKS